MLHSRNGRKPAESFTVKKDEKADGGLVVFNQSEKDAKRIKLRVINLVPPIAPPFRDSS